MKSKTVNLAGADLDLVLDALDWGAELLETVWLKDPGNTRQDSREIRANIARIWDLAQRLVVHAPEHHLAFSMPSARQVKIGSTGTSARLRRHLDKLGLTDEFNGARRGARATGTARNGERSANGHAPKPSTRNGKPAFPPVTSKLPLKGSRRAAAEGSAS